MFRHAYDYLLRHLQGRACKCSTKVGDYSQDLFFLFNVSTINEVWSHEEDESFKYLNKYRATWDIIYYPSGTSGQIRKWTERTI